MSEESRKIRKAKLRQLNAKIGDPWIWGIYISLIVISIIENYSASSRMVSKTGVYMPIIKHCIFLFAGVIGVIFIARHKYNKQLFLTLCIPVLALFTVLTLTYVLFFGDVINGAQRAITLPGGFTFQPSELSKVSIVTLLAYILAKNQKDKGITNRGLFLAFLAVAVYCGLMIQSGLTNCALLGGICLSMLAIGGAQWKKIGLGIIVTCVLGGMFWMIKSKGNQNEELLREAEQNNTEIVTTQTTAMSDSSFQAVKSSDPKSVDRWNMRQNRISKWWNNDSLVYWPITNENQQEMFSRMAQAHGGVFGVGVGRSRECSRLPLAFSDYIYSIIVEETGLAGGIVLLLLYLSLLGRATIIVRKCNRALPSLLIIGLASLITLQALFHMAINTGVFPVSGQPLPLISDGGTAILAMSLAFGLMLSVSRTIAISKDKTNNIPEKEVELPMGLNAENPTQIEPKNVWK